MTRSLRIAARDGIELAVLVDDAAGDGRGDGGRGGAAPFLLVHGLASTARLWDGVRAELSARGHAVAAVDLRGHGESGKPDHGYDHDTITADVVAVLDGLGWDRAFLAGQSWGGNVVLDVAARHPERVTTVACVDGGWIDLRAVGPWEVVAEELAPPALEGTPVEKIERWFRREHPDWPDEGVRGMLACFAVRDDGTVEPRLTHERHHRILRELFDHPPQAAYASVDAPVLLLVCRGPGPQFPSKESLVAEAEAAIASVRTVWVSADHDVHAQRPAEVADLLEQAATDGTFFTP